MSFRGLIWSLTVSSFLLTATACTNGFGPNASNSQGIAASNSDLSSIINSKSGVKLNFTSVAQSISAGICSKALNVELENASAQPLTFQGSVGIPLTSSLSGVSFYSDSSCANQESMVVLHGSSFLLVTVQIPLLRRGI